jgi:hypothetical protein
MKNILIVGDSWGVPNYVKGYNTVPEDHTEFRLRAMGYNVFNYSLNGGSNVDTISYAISAIENKELRVDEDVSYKKKTYADSGPEFLPDPNYRGEKIDWIIWFHTESIRASVQPIMFRWIKIEDIHELGCKTAYRAFKHLVEICGNPKTVVIGGQAPVEPMLYDYHNPTYIIEDWRSEIVGRKLPRCISLSRLDMIERSYHSIDEKLEIMNLHAEIYDAMNNKEQFFDACHPAAIPHKHLTNRLHTWFSE